jgi:hypothetical protein
MAIALLHLTPDQFYSMRVGEFWEAIAVYRHEQMEERRHIGELIRGHALISYNLAVAKKDRIKRASKFWPMPWDEDEDNAEAAEVRRLQGLSQEERDAEARKFLERIKDHGGSKSKSKDRNRG